MFGLLADVSSSMVEWSPPWVPRLVQCLVPRLVSFGGVGVQEGPPTTIRVLLVIAACRVGGSLIYSYTPTGNQTGGQTGDQSSDQAGLHTRECYLLVVVRWSFCFGVIQHIASWLLVSGRLRAASTRGRALGCNWIWHGQLFQCLRDRSSICLFCYRLGGHVTDPTREVWHLGRARSEHGSLLSQGVLSTAGHSNSVMMYFGPRLSTNQIDFGTLCVYFSVYDFPWGAPVPRGRAMVYGGGASPQNSFRGEGFGGCSPPRSSTLGVLGMGGIAWRFEWTPCLHRSGTSTDSQRSTCLANLRHIGLLFDVILAPGKWSLGSRCFQFTSIWRCCGIAARINLQALASDLAG